jgi:hypothetical protein
MTNVVTVFLSNLLTIVLLRLKFVPSRFYSVLKLTQNSRFHLLSVTKCQVSDLPAVLVDFKAYLVPGVAFDGHQSTARIGVRPYDGRGPKS